MRRNLMRGNFVDTHGVSAIIVVLALVALVFMGGILYYLFVWAPAQIQPTPTGSWTMSVNARTTNLLDRGIAQAGAGNNPTNPVVRFYHSYGKSLSALTKSDFLGGASMSTLGTAFDVGVNPEDNNIMFAWVYAGTDYYQSITDTMTANPRFKEYRMIDTDNDNRLEIVYSVDLTGLAPPNPATKPPLDVNIMIYLEDTAVALSQPADQDSIGTGTKTGVIEWTITGLAEKQAKGLARVYVTSNETTFGDLSKITSVYVEQVATATGGDITPDTGAKTYWVSIGISDYRELVYTKMITRPAGGSSTVKVSVSWETYFTAATNAVNYTLYLQTMGADEAVDTALSDAVALGG